jgi:hypothetical protein
MGAALISGIGLNIMEYSPKGQDYAKEAGLIIALIGVGMFLAAFKRLDRSYRRNRGTSRRFRITRKRAN